MQFSCRNQVTAAGQAPRTCGTLWRMRRLPLILLIFSAMALAQIPAADSRNTDIPNTDTHFVPATYKTLAEWTARRQELRTQILSAAGLLPMLPKSPLHPQIFGRVQTSTYSVE